MLRVLKRIKNLALDTSPSLDPYIGSWTGTSKNKSDPNDRRNKDNEPNRFDIEFTVYKAIKNKRIHSKKYVCSGTLSFSTKDANGNEQKITKEIVIEINPILLGSVAFYYQPKEPESGGFYGTGICHSKPTKNDNIYSGETIGFSSGNPDDTFYVSGELTLQKVIPPKIVSGVPLPPNP